MLKLSNTAAKDSGRNEVPKRFVMTARGRYNITLAVGYPTGAKSTNSVLILSRDGALMDFDTRPVDGVAYTANGHLFGSGNMLGNAYVSVAGNTDNTGASGYGYDQYTSIDITGFPTPNHSYSFIAYLYDPATLKYSMGVKLTAKTTL